MTPATRMLAVLASSTLFIPICAFGPQAANCASRTVDADFIVTAAPVYQPLAAFHGAERFPKGAQLILVHEGKAAPLLDGFAASADADVSFDGRRVLFSGKQAPTDPWQVWELTLEDHSLRKVISGGGDAIRPFYLPAGRLVYARKDAQGFELEAAGSDSADAFALIDADAESKLLQLSFLPGSAIPEDVLRDGRILFSSGFPLGTGSTPELFLVYSDGSGVESYRCDHGKARWGGKQLASGDVVFTHGTSLARFTSPLATEVQIVAPRAEYAGAIVETDAGDWLVSARAGAGAHYELKLLKRATPSNSISVPLESVLAKAGQDLVDPVLIAPRQRPNRHPSALHDWSYANLLALDARQSRQGDLKFTPASVRVETLDANGRAFVTGTAPVEADGSFFVKTPADRPIRFALLDSKGGIVRQEHGWFWIRRGEQRICVGCHTGPERSSENRVPAVLLRTTTPADLSNLFAPGSALNPASRGN